MKAALWMAGLGAAAAAEALRRRETDTIGLTRLDVPLPRWPRSLDGFQALVVSDIHVHPDAPDAPEAPDAPDALDTADASDALDALDGRGMRRREARLAGMLDGLECDVLLVPGDSANTRESAAIAVGVLRRARPRHGAFITFGNGEHKREGEAGRIAAEMGRLGHVLMNANARVPLDGQDLWILGVDDPSQDRDRLDMAARGIPEDAPKILLAHSPEIATRLHRAPVDVVVCGHTHGGQVCPPSGRALWTQTAQLERSSLGYGLFGPEDFARYNPHSLDRTRMYVSRGVGTAKLAIRAFCRPEIALLTLRSAG